MLSLPIIGRLLGLGRDLAAIGTPHSPARPDGISRAPADDGDTAGGSGPASTGAS